MFNKSFFGIIFIEVFLCVYHTLFIKFIIFEFTSYFFSSCDITEFYHQVAVLRAGMEPAWYGIGFPRTRDELEEKLSDELKAAMDNPLHHQVSRPLTFQYGD